LAQLAESLDKPLVFIIDELDRCRPDFAIRLIERIKHFFDIPKIVFILVMDKTQFSKVICHNYGYDKSLGEEYLDKFIDFQIPLPQINKNLSGDLVQIPTLRELFKKVGEDSDDIVFIVYASLKKYMSPRELKRKINIYALLKTTDVKQNMFLVLALIGGSHRLINDMVNIYDEIYTANKEYFGLNYSIFKLKEFLKNELLVNPAEFIQLIEQHKNLEATTLGFGGEELKNEKRLELYSKYVLKPLDNLAKFSNQFQDYLNAHLWDEIEGEQS
jgi:hypothetical protein